MSIPARDRYAVGRLSTFSFNRTSSRVLLFACLALCMMVVLGGCAEDTSERQFANDPRTPNPTPTVAVSEISAATPFEVKAESSPEAVVARRGAPDFIYAYIDGALRSFDGSKQQVVFDGPIEAFDASPSGHKVAVVTSSTPQTGDIAYSVEVFDEQGTRELRFEDVLRADSVRATPTSDSTASEQVAISWAPQGGHVLLSTFGGELVDIPLAGKPTPIQTRSPLQGIFKAKWSPRGDAIGVLMRDENGRGELATVTTGVEPAVVSIIAPAGESTGGEKTIERFAWRANGAGILYLEMRRTDTGLVDGKIIDWDMESNTSSIIATGAQVGPSGSVTSLSVSADGKAVLYSISVVIDGEWSFSGIYVRTLADGRVYQIPIEGESRVTAAWWKKNGIVWTQSADSAGDGTVITMYMITADGVRIELARFDTGDEAGTPAASPVTGATPVLGGTPAGATPVTTTPLAATPARATPVTATPAS